MNLNDFWNLIATSRQASNGNLRAQSQYIKDALMQKSVDEILAFDAICTALMDRAYRAALWDAAYIIGCGCSDDGFMDFRAWLIQQGKPVYETALEDPETLVDVVDDRWDTQDGNLWAIAANAYEEKTGQDFLDVAPLHNPPQLIGEFCSDDKRHATFPKLAQRFTQGCDS